MTVPAEKFNTVEVYHVSDKGLAYGKGSRWRFRNGRIDGLLDEWLNCSTVTLYPAPAKILFNDVPRDEGTHVAFSPREIQVGPVGVLPFVDLGDQGSFTAAWPAGGQTFKTVSPVAEAAEAVGPLDALVENGLTWGVSRRTGERTLWNIIRWPENIEKVVAGGEGSDLMLAHNQMRFIAERSVNDIDAAAVEAARLATGHVFEGHTYQALSWFCPLYTQGEHAVLFEAEEFGFTGKRVNDLWRNPDFLALMNGRVKIRCAWGATGLFWALLLERLEQGQSFRRCQACSRIISGRKDKTFCSQRDNPECFRQRQSDRQRLSRRNRAKPQ